MADSSYRAAIVVAVIAFLGTIGAAVITNWDKIVGRASEPARIDKSEPRMSEIEWDTDRFGGDYTGFPLPTDNPKQCEDACRSDPKCLAWTYIKPNTGKGPKPLCSLKNTVPPRQNNKDCVSGTKIS